MSAAYPPTFKYVQLEVKGNYVIITLNRPPVNGMNLDVWTELFTALDATEKQPQIRGAIFASGLKKDVFTAGNDLNEIYSKSTNESRFLEFTVTQNTFLARLYASRLATVAAIRGACPAGGCVFAMVCDYRLMTSDVPGAVIGLNEVALGISVPPYWIQLYERLLGNRRAEASLLTGRMLTPQQALDGGLLHALVPKASLIDEAEKALAVFLKSPDLGRVLTKTELRADLSKRWIESSEEEAKRSWEALKTPELTAVLQNALAKLSGGAKSKL